MEPSFIESGLELLARLETRLTLHALENILFPNGLPRNATIELCGNLSSGKVILFTQLIAKCILPVKHNGETIGGLGVSVLFINTNYHFVITKLRSSIINFLYQRKIPDLTPGTIDTIVRRSLSNLIIINCYDSSSYFLTLQTLDDILSSNKNISLVAIDNITSYYWEDRQKGGSWMMNRYIRNTLKIVQNHTFQRNILLLYTRVSDSTYKDNIQCVDKSELEKINFRINLQHNEESNTYLCTVESRTQTNNIYYTIDSNGIMWNKSL
ncbi:DNA repair protein XRCC2 [Chelonus insularis]|uniref:DNA repair protein XRCC2 n=1 Tax=Chelonus insularis TaxID=460826 RepID=UPI00158B673B|nr:DNA repair protein XRCC2-like [Chelonus insularis]